ncbi:glycosyltransferase family A protein [Massilibacteroides sp.]|uniref:glycosyltransferase family 2 protein n=1 Tax=Massilibacteroides sp. TaxID=2034766 RepID=UPI00262B4DB7|nr:glycosyltransferase family A protein [Massilibacteroides sp.]MDD4515646.1 glycosyltransferase family A protein [Massilibacteroides sp.]
MHTNIKFSVIIPSYLGNYNGCATNRKYKLERAINSVLNQTYKDFEIIVIADGCKDTVYLCREIEDKRLRVVSINKRPVFSGEVRNTGLRFAKGNYIIYLDSDDMYEPDHMERIAEKLDDYDWVFFNDSQFNGTKYPQNNTLTFGSAKTSNICHKNGLEVKWTDGYQHDFEFIKQLMNYSYKHIGDSGYLVCHVPDLIDY